MDDLDWTKSEEVDLYCSGRSVPEECGVEEVLRLALFDIGVMAGHLSQQDMLLLAGDILGASERHLGKGWWFD